MHILVKLLIAWIIISVIIFVVFVGYMLWWIDDLTKEIKMESTDGAAVTLARNSGDGGYYYFKHGYDVDGSESGTTAVSTSKDALATCRMKKNCTMFSFDGSKMWWYEDGNKKLKATTGWPENGGVYVVMKSEEQK